MVTDVSRPAEVRDRRELATLSSVCLAHWVSHVHILVLALLIPLLNKELGVGFLDLGVAITIFSIVSGLTQAPVGFLVDRLGPRRILTLGLCLGGLAFIVLGLALSYPALLACAAIAGLANSVYHPCDYAILAAGIDDKRMGRAFSIHTFSGFLGSAMAPGMVLFAVSWFGIKAALVLMGLLGPLAAAILLLVPDVVAKPAATATGKAAGSLASVLSPAIIALMVFFTLLSLSTSGISNFAVSALNLAYDVSFSAANVALTGFLGAGALGVLAGGYLADRTTRHGQVAAACFTANAVIVLLIGLLPMHIIVLVPTLTLAGFLWGIIAPSRDMLVRKAAPPGAAGRAFGIVSTGFNIGGIIGPLLYGWIMDMKMPRTVFLVAAAFMIATVLLALVTDHRQSRATAN
ncbi:MAG TPA: MFS transporter [Hyphomicrobiaceae bacterium]|nr:MFS transporter [Hyphomicrobiaceae bacterium]